MGSFNRLRKMHAKLHKLNIIYKERIKSSCRLSTKTHMGDEDYPIDFVVTWVDNNDREWQKEKNHYWKQYHIGDISIKGNGEERYRDWDQFMYWFRGVEKYAPWVRNVFLVTCGHVPEWINRNAPKLKIIKHSDFIPTEYLPTFNCNPIELNLHRIEGLSEHFVYFNDDFLLTSPVVPSDFFVNSLPVLCGISFPLRNWSYNGPFAHQQFGVIGLLNGNFNIEKEIEKSPEKWFSKIYGNDVRYNKYAYFEGYIPGLFFSHLAYPLRKKTMEEVWSDFEIQMKDTCKNKFRTALDVIAQIFTMYDIFRGEYMPCTKSHYGKMYGMLSEQMNEVADAIVSKKYKMICYNDSIDVTEDNYELIRNTIGKALQSAFPEKSIFEL